MEKINFSLLKQGEIIRDRNLNQLDCLLHYGALAANTDLAIALGSNMPRLDSYVLEDKSLKGRTGIYATQSIIHGDTVQIIMSGGEDMCIQVGSRGIGIRPVIRSKELVDFASVYAKEGFNGTKYLEYGEYPQYVVRQDLAVILEDLNNRGDLKATGKTYTFDSRKYNEINKGFEPVEYAEYECGGKKFVRILANPYDEYGCKLSNGEWYTRGEAIWIEVSPVQWLIDEKSGSLVSLRTLLAGIRFNDPFKGYTGNLAETEMYNYMNAIMKNDILNRSKLSVTKKESVGRTKTLEM